MNGIFNLANPEDFFGFIADSETAARNARLAFRSEDLRILCSPGDRAGWGMHKHVCPECNTAWQHDDLLSAGTREQFDLGHTCPTCGTEGVREKVR